MEEMMSQLLSAGETGLFGISCFLILGLWQDMKRMRKEIDALTQALKDLTNRLEKVEKKETE